MNTLSITVDHANQALMLADWLKSIRFVREVNVHQETQPLGNVLAVQRALDAIKTKHVLANITDPVAYQKTIRDEAKLQEAAYCCGNADVREL